MGLVSKSCEYGIRAALYVAAHGKDRLTPIPEIARELGLSFHFLTKILQRLTRTGILRSSRGAGGGVMLARPPGCVFLLEIILAIDDSFAVPVCLLGGGCAEREGGCPLHLAWLRERSRIESIFGETTLEDLVGGNGLPAGGLDA